MSAVKKRRTAAVVALVAMAALLGAGTGAGPAGARPGDGDGRPEREPTPVVESGGCALRPSAGRSPRHEWLGCIGVAASLDRVPQLGGVAELTATVRIDPHVGTRLGEGEIRVELPPQLAWTHAPEGFTVESTRSNQPERAGAVSTALQRRALRGGDVVALRGTVRAIQAGAAQIRVRALAPDGSAVRAGEDDIFLTVGGPGGSSVRGHPAAGAHPVAPVPPAAMPPAAVHGDAAAPADAVVPWPGPTVRTESACDAWVSGRFVYADQDGAWHSQVNMQVQVYDDDTLSGDDLLSAAYTDGDGRFNLCYDVHVDGFGESGTADMYVRLRTENTLWKVVDGDPLTFQTSVINDVKVGSVTDLGTMTSGDGTLQRGLHAFDEVNQAWGFIPKPSSSCWDQNDSTCRQVVVNWAPDSIDGTYYDRNSNQVHLAADDPNSATTVTHELGHAVMDDVYNDSLGPSENCNPHYEEVASSTTCAWVEGWADWFSLTVNRDTFFRWPDGGSVDLENQSWGNGWDVGDVTQGRVVGALLDITDPANEPYWDSYGEGWTNLWTTFTRHVSPTFASFWVSRLTDGFNGGDAGALSCLYQNTIDYGFRQPLGDAALTRPATVPTLRYSYTTKYGYWSVVAIRPPAGADFDLWLYDDRAQSTFLAGSTYGGNTVDFVAVDSNRRPLGDYYPMVNLYSGWGDYSIQVAQTAASLPTGSVTLTMGSADVVQVRDTWINAGQVVSITVTPLAGQDPDLFLMGSTTDASTWVVGRPGARAGSTGHGAGEAESLIYLAPTSGWYGVVVLNRSGAGSYTLTRS